MKWLYLISIHLFLFSCTEHSVENESSVDSNEAKEVTEISTTSIVVLGTTQDAGFPQIACTKDCCKDIFGHPELYGMVSSLGLIDVPNAKTYIFDATPNFVDQMRMIMRTNVKNKTALDTMSCIWIKKRVNWSVRIFLFLKQKERLFLITTVS
jgi:pyrroloquinoline quinone biosynthesis protein B